MCVYVCVRVCARAHACVYVYVDYSYRKENFISILFATDNAKIFLHEAQP